MANAGIPSPELEGLRDEIGKLRKEMADFRIERAAKHLEHMRNWMGFYTPTVTAVFLFFALLGYRGLTDIQNNKEKFDATSSQAAKLLAEVTAKFESIKKEDEDFRGQIADNARVVQQNKTVLAGFKSDLNELQMKNGELKATETRMTNDLNLVSGKIQELTATSRSFSTSLSSSVALTTGIGDFLSSSLNVPIITSAVESVDGVLTIQGQGFGPGGKVSMSTAPLSEAITQLTGPLTPSSAQLFLPALHALSVVEIPGTATWSDTSVVSSVDVKKFFTETFHEDFDTRKSAVGIIVEVGSGSQFVTKSSNVYWILPAPPPPIALRVEEVR
jgi:flagellar motor protein MotB